jgi:hypothetical protein
VENSMWKCGKFHVEIWTIPHGNVDNSTWNVENSTLKVKVSTFSTRIGKFDIK